MLNTQVHIEAGSVQQQPNTGIGTEAEPNLADCSNVSRELRWRVIEPLKSTQPQLAKFLAKACWTWQPDSLSITLLSSRVQQQLKNSNSLLLRFFQKVLDGSSISPITKLSFLNQIDDPQWAQVRQESGMETQVIPQATARPQAGEFQLSEARKETTISSSQVVSEQIIDDYSELPPEIQILQKVLLAQVKEVCTKDGPIPETDYRTP